MLRLEEPVSPALTGAGRKSPWEESWTLRLQLTVLTSLCVCVCMLSHVQLFVTPGTVAHQAPLSMGLSRQEYWSGLPFPPPGDLPNPGIKPKSPALQADALPSESPGKPQIPDQRVGVRNFQTFFFKGVPFYIPCTKSHQSSGSSQHFVLVSFSILALLVGKCGGFSLWF